MGIDYNIRRSPRYVLLLMAVVGAAILLIYLLDGDRASKMPVYPFNFQWEHVTLNVEGKISLLASDQKEEFRQLKFHPASNRVRFTGNSTISTGKNTFLLGISEKPLKATFIRLPDGKNYVINGDITEDFRWVKKND